MWDKNGINMWVIVQKVGQIITIHDPKLCPLYPKVMKLLSLALLFTANKTQRVQWSNLCEKTYGKSLLRFLTEHTLILSAWACVPRAAAPLPNISQSLWIPVRLEQLLSQHYPLSCPSPLQNTRLWWLFSFWILVNIFILHRRGSCAMIRDEELLTIFVLFLHIVAGSGKGRRRRVSPIPEIHLNLCANKSQRFPWRGRATFKACESVLPQQGKTRFIDMAD